MKLRRAVEQFSMGLRFERRMSKYPTLTSQFIGDDCSVFNYVWTRSHQIRYWFRVWSVTTEIVAPLNELLIYRFNYKITLE